MMKRRRFSEEFKREAVHLAYESDRRVAEVARELEVRPELLRRWKHKYAGTSIGQMSAQETEMRQLRRSLSRVREERDILKKALAIFSDRRP